MLDISKMAHVAGMPNPQSDQQHPYAAQSMALAAAESSPHHAGCKVYVLDLSEMAHVLGYPACDTERFVTDPEFGTLLPNASYLVPKANLTPPMEQYTNMYPFHVLPHYESLNSGNTSLHSLR